MSDAATQPATENAPDRSRVVVLGASNVTRGPTGRDYRITSLARNVDTALKQLTVGTTVVDYSAAELAGYRESTDPVRTHA